MFNMKSLVNSFLTLTTTIQSAELHHAEPHHPPIEHPGGDDPWWGMHPALYALIFGIVSGLSLPIGSYLGINFSPVSDLTCALMMAFGAGALLFAVTVELYGHALHEVSMGRLGLAEMFTTICGALCGAAFYLTINRWLEEYLMHDTKHEVADGKDEEKGEEKKSKAEESAPLMAAIRAQSAAKEAEKAEEKKSTPRTGKELWGKARQKKTILRMTSVMGKTDLQRIRGREKALRALHDPEEIQHAKSVAFALFLGLLVDGVPEGILMGFLSAEGHLTPVLIISLFVANFPEAFSSASLLIQAGMKTPAIVGMWTGLCVLVGCLGGLSCYLLLLWFPDFGQPGRGNHLPFSILVGIALTEGITGGAMIACIASVMLPEAFERAGKGGPFYQQSGFFCCAGFLLSVALKALFG